MTLNVAWSAVFQKLLICLDFAAQPPLYGNGLMVGKRENITLVSGSSLGENTSLVSEVRGEWFEQIDNRNSNNSQRYNQTMHTMLPVTSAKNRKLKPQFARAHQTWTLDVWINVAWFQESRFLQEIDFLISCILWAP